MRTVTVLFALAFALIVSVGSLKKVIEIGAEREGYREAWESARAELEATHRTVYRHEDVAYKCVRR